MTNSDQFADLVTRLITLLEQYVELAEDIDEHPLHHFAMLHTLISLRFLERYANGDPQAIDLMQQLYEQQGELLEQIKRH